MKFSNYLTTYFQDMCFYIHCQRKETEVNYLFFSCSIQLAQTNYEFSLTSGFVSLPDSKKKIVVSIVYKVPPKTLQVKARGNSRLEVLTSIKYSEPVPAEQYHEERESTRKSAIEVSCSRDD